MKQVLITGAGGFIGSNLIRKLLTEKYEVHAIVRETTNLWRLRDIESHCTMHIGDLGDKIWVQTLIEKVRPDIVIHTAQYGGYPFQKDVEKTIKTNFVSTTHLIDAAQKVGVERFINTGSSSEYGKKLAPMNEGDLLEPNSVYGVAKAASTLYAVHCGREEKLPIVTLRLFSVYGPWEEPGRLMPTVMLRALDHKELELVSPAIARDFVYMDDVVDAYMAVVEKKVPPGAILNICTGIQQTLKDVADNLSHAVGTKLNVKWTGKGRSFDTDMWVGDGTHTKKLLGWHPRFALRKGIAEMLAWMREHRKQYEAI
jgi:nucleoside-diphosphate-sugar epimerase